MTIAMRNGTPQRKQLSDQLDRLDGIIDCLADGLSEAVRDAVTKGTASAIQQILVEAVTNPTTRDLLRQAFAPEAAPSMRVPAPVAETIPVAEAPVPATRKASFLARCTRAVGNAGRMVASLPRKLLNGVKSLFRKTKGITRRLNIAWQLKKAAFFGVGIGVAVAVVSLSSHPLASILSGIGAATTAFAVQLGIWFRNTARQLIS